jgi:hypothetical protein
MSVDLTPYAEEAGKGLPNEMPDMDIARERQAFYDYDGARYERRFRRDSESSFDFQGRSHRASGFLHECVSVLCRHLYNPGPARRWSKDGPDRLLQRVYADNWINAIWHACDTLATLNDTCAIQIDAGRGDFKIKPITYRVWGREDVAIFPDPDNANEPIVVCTVDQYDMQTRYRLWSDTEVWTGLTKKVTDGWTMGRVVDHWIKEDHDYGCLPFTMVHYHLPIRSIKQVIGIGTYLWKAEVHIDNRLMKMDESIPKYLDPMLLGKGFPDGWKPDIEPGRLILAPRANPNMNQGGDYEPGEPASIDPISTMIDVAGSWDDLSRFISQALQASEIPESAIRMEQQLAAPSGIALMIEQEPLLKRAETRREMYKVYENDLATRTLRCIQGHYGKVVAA